MDLNESLLYDIYNMHLNTAKKAYKNHQFDIAKKEFLLASEAMYKLAKNSEGNLKLTRMERAKKILIKVNDIDNYPSKNQKDKQQLDNENSVFLKSEKNKLRFEDIAGLEDVKKAIKIKMIYPVLYPEKYLKFQKKTGGGIILYGPPGTGKTMIARAISNEVNAAFYVVKPSDILSKWVGSSEENIKNLFESVKKEERAIIFFDELEGLFSQRGNDIHNDKRVSEFLQHIDGFEEKNKNLLIIGATNRPWDIDSAARRPGRFSELIYVPLPDKEARSFLINKGIKDVPGFEGIDTKIIVEKTEGFSGADIDELCDRAKEYPLLRSIEEEKIDNLVMSDFELALTYVKPSVDKKELDKYEKFSKE